MFFHFILFLNFPFTQSKPSPKSTSIKCVKCQTFDIWHIKTKNPFTTDVLNAKKFSMDEQYHSKFKMVQTQTLNQKNNFLLFFSLLSIIYLTFSLSSHISVSLPSTSTFLSTILSPLSLSQPLSLSLSPSLTSRQSSHIANLAMVSSLLKATHLAMVSLTFYMFLDFN